MIHTEVVKLKDLRTNLDRYLSKLGKVEGFTVIRRSEPIFNISPVKNSADELWEPVVDFTRLKKGGIQIKDILSRL